MELKIEEVPLTKAPPRSVAFKNFCEMLAKLEPDQSIVTKLHTNHRAAITAIEVVLGRWFGTEKTDVKGMYRVGRLK